MDTGNQKRVEEIIERARRKSFPVIGRYYEPGTPLWRLLIVHSEKVACKALDCAMSRHLDIDMDFLAEASLLHDIGIVDCDAPGILCTGPEPYIRHGILGREKLDSLGLFRHGLVCERHTGAGLTVDDIRRQGLPLPLRDMTPQTTEEKLICYADKFFSKSGDPEKEKPLEKVRAGIARHGEDSLMRFDALHSLFGVL